VSVLQNFHEKNKAIITGRIFLSKVSAKYCTRVINSAIGLTCIRPVETS